jgi:hypothetical protein
VEHDERQIRDSPKYSRGGILATFGIAAVLHPVEEGCSDGFSWFQDRVLLA